MAEKRAAPEDAGSSPAKRAATISSAGTGAWQTQPTLLARDYGSPSSAVVYGFDLDDTLIKTKSGKTSAQNSDDWEWWNPCVPAMLKEFSELGHKLVIFTNQKGLATGSMGEFTAKVDKIQASLGLPVLVLAATGNDLLRKPRTGLWQHMVANFNGGAAPEIPKCRYVGDAAGRPALKKVKKDFSDSDLKFALNLGVDFQTPEEHFLGQKDGDDGRPRPSAFAFDPRRLGSVREGGAAKPTGLGPAGMREVVLVMGAPGSGKSSLAISHFPAYVRANQDTLKTKEKCVKVCEDSLKVGKSVIVDNQNKDPATRKLYVDVAKKAGVPIRALVFQVPKEMCFHLNAFRSLRPQNEEEKGRDGVPPMIIHSYYKNSKPPDKKEGFSDIIAVTEECFEPRGSSADIALLRSFFA